MSNKKQQKATNSEKKNKRGLRLFIVAAVVLLTIVGVKIFKEKNTGTTIAGAEKLYDADWDIEELTNSGVPVILDFTAEWCIPCRTFNPLLEKTKEKYGNNVIIKIVDVDKYPEIAAQYPVKVIPTQILYNEEGEAFTPSSELNIFGFRGYSGGDGSEITVHEGAMSATQLEDMVLALGTKTVKGKEIEEQEVKENEWEEIEGNQDMYQPIPSQSDGHDHSHEGYDHGHEHEGQEHPNVIKPEGIDDEDFEPFEELEGEDDYVPPKVQEE